jgi:hypothetical protein
MIVKHVDNVEKKISDFIKKAKKKKKKAKKAKVKSYFAGQKDAFEKAAIELKNLKHELETSVEDEEKDQEEPEQQVEGEEREDLLNKALEKGVIIRRTSFYLHSDLPNGKAHGKQKMLQALSERSFCEKIQHQIASAENTVKEEQEE